MKGYGLLTNNSSLVRECITEVKRWPLSHRLANISASAFMVGQLNPCLDSLWMSDIAPEWFRNHLRGFLGWRSELLQVWSSAIGSGYGTLIELVTDERVSSGLNPQFLSLLFVNEKFSMLYVTDDQSHPCVAEVNVEQVDWSGLVDVRRLEETDRDCSF